MMILINIYLFSCIRKGGDPGFVHHLGKFDRVTRKVLVCACVCMAFQVTGDLK